jgi:hypothetical protein
MEKISSIIKESLRSGTLNSFNSNEDVLSFILGAIDCGFSIKLNGYMPTAKYGKIEVFARFKRDEDNLTIVIFKGKEKQGQFDYGYNEFLWNYAEVIKGRFNIKIDNQKQFICSTL